MRSKFYAFVDKTLFDLGRQFKWSYLPPLMIYVAAGISGLTGIVGTFFVKDYLNLSAAFLAGLGFWAGIPWALKMPLGHLVDLIWNKKNYMVFVGASLISLSLLIMYGLIIHTEWMSTILTVETWFVISVLLSPIGYVVQDVVADAMTVEAVPLVDDNGENFSRDEIKLMHTTMQTLGRFAIIGGTVLVALANVILFKGVDDSTTITALTLDLSDGGKAVFGGDVSGSAASTGSFGLLQGDGSELTGITATLPSGVISGSSAGLTILGDGKVGINNATPQLKLDVSNGASGIAAHFGGNVSTSNGVVGGISFGYYESNNANYRKAGIIQEQIGDSHARGDLHLIVNTQGGQLSATAADARLTIDGLTGDVLFPGANQKISGSLTSTGSFGNIQTPLEGRVISNFTELIKVTVVSDGGNHYAFEGATAPSIQVSEGKTYRFDISDATVGSHPFRLSTTQDGTHGGGSAYTTGVTLVGTQGQAGAYLEIKVDKNTANALYYYCTAHPGMGNDGRLLKNDLMNLAAIKVTGNQVDFTNLPTSNPNVAGRLWNDSGTVKISSG